MRTPFWFIAGHLPPVTSHDGGQGELCGVPFIRVLISFVRAPSSQPHHLPNAPPPNTIASGIRISAREFWGHKHSDHCTSNVENPNYSMSSSTRGIVCSFFFFNCSYSSHCKRVSYGGSDLQFSDNSSAENLFMCLMAIHVPKRKIVQIVCLFLSCRLSYR